MQELIFLFSKSPVLSSCVDSYTRTQPEPPHRVILNNAHFRTNAEMIDVLVHNFRLISGLVRSGPGFNEGLVWLSLFPGNSVSCYKINSSFLVTLTERFHSWYCDKLEQPKIN